VTDSPFDEFSYLPAQAAEAGIDPAPPVRRIAHTLDDGRVVSALQYGDPRTGAFTAPAVTFLHGAGLNAHTWDTTVLGLGLPALAVDLPGHGDSSWRPDADYAGRVLGADIAPALAAWTGGPQVLVGQSLGGLSAAALAAVRPDLVRRLVVVDITPGIDPNGSARQVREFFAGPTHWASHDELVERALSFGLGGSRAAASRGVRLNSRVRPDGRVEWKHHFAHIANALAADPETAAAVAERQAATAGILSESGWEDLAAVRAPITLVRGDRGYVSESERDEFARRLPAARIVEVEARHNVQEDIPLPLGRLIAEVAA